MELTQDHGLGIVLEDEEAQNLLASGSDIRHSKDVKEIKWVQSRVGLNLC